MRGMHARILYKPLPLPLQIPRCGLLTCAHPRINRRRLAAYGSIHSQQGQNVRLRVAPLPSLGPGNGMSSPFLIPAAQSSYVNPQYARGLLWPQDLRQPIHPAHVSIAPSPRYGARADHCDAGRLRGCYEA